MPKDRQKTDTHTHAHGKRHEDLIFFNENSHKKRIIGGRADEDGSEDIDTLHFENTLRGAGAGAFFGRAGM